VSGVEGLYREGSSYLSAGNTDADGVVLAFIDGHVTSTYFRMAVLGHAQTKLQNIASNSFVVFQTQAVVVKLLDHNGNLLTADELRYRDGTNTYQSLGTNISSAPIEMLPLSYYFQATLLGHTQTRLVNVTSENPVVFQTALVTVELNDHNGADLSAEELLYRHGDNTYHSLGTTTTGQSIEMLPLSYYFQATWLGHTQSRLVNVTSENPVVFQTVEVTVKLEQGGSPVAADEFFYRDGSNVYQSMGTLVSQVTKEMLPLSYYFKVDKSSSSKTKLWNVNTNPTVLFTWDGSNLSKQNATTALASFELTGNYPNPFNPSTTISYSVPSAKL
jgi:hypothetical protein